MAVSIWNYDQNITNATSIWQRGNYMSHEKEPIPRSRENPIAGEHVLPIFTMQSFKDYSDFLLN